MGVNNTVMSSVVMKGGSESALTKALENANEEAKKLDPKKGDKKKGKKD